MPPTLYKDHYFENETYNRMLEPVWKKAKEALSKCKELIIIGYSFPSTDFATKKLFLEAFENHHLERLIIVNPDTSTVQKAKELCHFDKPIIVCKDLTELMKMYTSHP